MINKNQVARKLTVLIDTASHEIFVRNTEKQLNLKSLEQNLFLNNTFIINFSL